MSSLRFLYRYITKYPMLMNVGVFIFKPLSCFEVIYNAVTSIERILGFFKVLRPGDIAIQAGVDLDGRNDADLWHIAKIIGKEGKVIAIEPDPNNIKKIEKAVSMKKFECEIVVVKKALYSKTGKDRLLLGTRAAHNRVCCIPESDRWKTSEESYTSKKVSVELDTLDNILIDNGVDSKKITYVNLTINGSESEALKGMVNLLTNSENLSITVAAGRENEGYGKRDIGYVDGQPDHIVISKFISNFGFRVKLKRFYINKFGYVIGTKGNKKEFM